MKKKQKTKDTYQPFIVSETYKINQVLERRVKLRTRLAAIFKDRVVRGEDFDDLVDLAMKYLPKVKVKPDEDRKAKTELYRGTVAESLRYLAGFKLTMKRLDDACWRLAGNVDRLGRFRAALPWHTQPWAEWVPAQIIHVTFQKGGRRGVELGHELTFQIMAGASCARASRTGGAGGKGRARQGEGAAMPSAASTSRAILCFASCSRCSNVSSNVRASRQTWR